MKSPRLMITSLLLCHFSILLSSSCSFQNIDDISDQRNDLIEEENPGSESFEHGDFEVFENIESETSMNLAVSGNVLHQITFEESSPFSLAWNQFCCGHSSQIVTNPLDPKNKVGRFELRNTDRVRTVTTTSARAELLFPSQSNKERWYAVSVFFPTSGYSKDGVTELIMQWHQSGNSPPNGVEVKDDKIFLRSLNKNSTSNSDAVYTNHPIADVERGRWNEFIFHYIHSPYSDGLIEIWYNGKKLNSIKGPNIRSGRNLPRFKVGIYKWKWNNGNRSDTNKRILFFNNILIANEDASLGDLRISGSPPLNQPSSNDSKNQTPAINDFFLIDAQRDAILGTIKEGSSIMVNTNRLNITANASPGFIGKIKFELTGARNNTRTESSPPFALFGDDGKGNYYFGSGLAPGNYSLTATPIIGNVNGISKTVKFQIKN